MASNQIQLPALSKGWSVAEKIIAVILAAGSVFVLYSEVSLIAQTIRSGYLESTQQSYMKLIQMHHLPVLVSVLGLFGGCMMLFNDKTGWILSLIATAMFGFLFFVSSRSNAANSTFAFSSFYKSYGVTSLTCFLLFILLLVAPLRKKYKPTSKNWMWIVGLILILVLDKLFL